jgi:hypothetical protein
MYKFTILFYIFKIMKTWQKRIHGKAITKKKAMARKKTIADNPTTYIT